MEMNRPGRCTAVVDGETCSKMIAPCSDKPYCRKHEGAAWWASVSKEMEDGGYRLMSKKEVDNMENEDSTSDSATYKVAQGYGLVAVWTDAPLAVVDK